MGYIANCRQPSFKNFAIKNFIRRYKVNMAEAIYDNYKEYPNFNAFFTRMLKPGIRPIDKHSSSIVCPADGIISQFGQINEGTLLQAKGHKYSVFELLGGDSHSSENFIKGCFATIYLSPKDYHRVHMPFSGKLKIMRHIPGQLFSVNLRTARNVQRLFARNERVAALFDTEIGPMAIILIGAMIVASMSTVWHGIIDRAPKKQIRTWEYQNIFLEKGAEMGHFQLGSTVILLFGQNQMAWEPTLVNEQAIRMGEKIGQTPISPLIL